MKLPNLAQATTGFSLKSLFSYLQPSASGSQLVAVHNGFSLCLALLTFDKNTAHIAIATQSSSIDFNTALEEALNALKEQAKAQGMSLPRQVSLVLNSCLPGLLDLPIDASKPRKETEMNSMISWEMEGAIADASDLYVIGCILEGRGYLNSAQRNDIAVELELRRSTGTMLSRFGETAIDLQLIDQDALKECLQLQEKQMQETTDLRCSWQLQEIAEEGQQHHLWYCSVLDVRMRKQWVKAFAQHGLKVSGLYPFQSLSASAVKKQASNGSALIIELHQEMLICCRMQKGVIDVLQSVPRTLTRSIYEQCHSLLSESLHVDIEQIFLVGEPDESGQQAGVDMTSQLANSLQRQVQWLTVDNQGDASLPALVASAMHSAAMLAHKDSDGVKLPQLKAHDPAPPIWKNARFYRYAIPMLFVTALAAHASYSVWLRDDLEDELITLQVNLANASKITKQLNSMNSQSKQSLKELTEIKAQISTVQSKLKQLDEKVMARGKFMPRLLKAVVVSVSDKVMLDSIIEPDRKGRGNFHLRAWSVDNPSATEFTQQLEDNLLRLGYQVADPDIREGVGRYGLKGYSIDLWVIPNQQQGTAEQSSSEYSVQRKRS